MRLSVSAWVGLATLLAAPALAAPRPPELLRVRPLDGCMEVAWVKSSDDPLYVSGYEVVRSPFAAGPYERVCVTLKGAGVCTDRRVQPQKAYYYRARALGIGDEGASEFTREVRGEMPPPPPPPER